MSRLQVYSLIITGHQLLLGRGTAQQWDETTISERKKTAAFVDIFTRSWQLWSTKIHERERISTFLYFGFLWTYVHKNTLNTIPILRPNWHQFQTDFWFLIMSWDWTAQLFEINYRSADTLLSNYRPSTQQHYQQTCIPLHVFS